MKSFLMIACIWVGGSIQAADREIDARIKSLKAKDQDTVFAKLGLPNGPEGRQRTLVAISWLVCCEDAVPLAMATNRIVAKYGLACYLSDCPMPEAEQIRKEAEDDFRKNHLMSKINIKALEAEIKLLRNKNPVRRFLRWLIGSKMERPPSGILAIFLFLQNMVKYFKL